MGAGWVKKDGYPGLMRLYPLTPSPPVSPLLKRNLRTAVSAHYSAVVGEHVLIPPSDSDQP